MDISIITPVYNGNKYLNNYMRMMNSVVGNSNAEVEIILVNDSPEIPIEYDKSIANGYEVIIYNNEKNSGIHESRVNGLKQSHGKYILFLDQDDMISEHCLKSQLNAIKDADVVLGNGIFELGGERKKIFGNKFSQDFASEEWVYKWIRDFIVSPGQCLIKKESIPDFWISNPMKNNGTDDYLLWLLMFNKGMKVNCNYNAVYLHRDTGVNLSSDDAKMYKSTKELLELLSVCEEYDNKNIALIKRRIEYKRVDRSNKLNFIIASVKNLDVFIVNVLYRMFFRGCIIK